MSYAMQFFDSDGNLTLDTSDYTVVFLGTYSVTFPGNAVAGSTQTITISGFTIGNWYALGISYLFDYSMSITPHNGYLTVTKLYTDYSNTPTTGTIAVFRSYA